MADYDDVKRRVLAGDPRAWGLIQRAVRQKGGRGRDAYEWIRDIHVEAGREPPEYRDFDAAMHELEGMEQNARSRTTTKKRDPQRTLARGPRRGRGQRTIFWEITEPFNDGEEWVQLYVREPGALAWAKNQGTILGSSWEGTDVGGDFAYTSVPLYEGWYEDAREEYPNVRFHQLEYSPPRQWLWVREGESARAARGRR